ncbi:MAG: aKG-HExxH-type peptide beta-hydroxylase [Trebonia sp.]
MRAPALSDLHGMPFLDDEFASRRLLAIIAAARYGAAARQGLTGGLSRWQAEAWLTPARAYLVNAGPTPMPAQPFRAARRQQVTDALARLAAVMPAWAPLLILPVRYARLQPAVGAISASSRDWPQHVLLADDAFATDAELREQLVHELAHQWLYLIEDVWPLDTPGAARLTLPSGTRGRAPAEVLGAAHVAAVLTRMYAMTGGPGAESRISALTAYGRGCLELAQTASADLTSAGTMIAQRLKEAQ